MPMPEPLTAIVQHLVTLPGICLVLGSAEAVCEMFLDPESVDFRIDDPFITMENGPWHIHLDATTIRQIAFVVTPDTAHGQSSQHSYSVRFFDSTGRALLRAFFLGMYDAEGHLKPERLQQYEALRACGGGKDVLVLSTAPPPPRSQPG
ncbi:MAG: ChuX/HutX family heme-like substrate-binding protein [Candidatus Tectimicrobiota bacterium]